MRHVSASSACATQHGATCISLRYFALPLAQVVWYCSAMSEKNRSDRARTHGSKKAGQATSITIARATATPWEPCCGCCGVKGT